MKSILSFTLLSCIVLSAVVYGNGPDGKKKSAFDLKNLNTSVSPKTDFYEYAIGGWLKNNPIPDQYSSWGSFEFLYEENLAVLKKIFEDAASDKSAKMGSFVQKVGTFYRLGMDEAKIEKDGYTPIKEDIARIDAIKNGDDLAKTAAYFHINLGAPFFSFGVDADAKNSSWNITQLYQGGTSLPDRDYYLQIDDRMKETREKYLQHIANMFKLISVDDASAKKYAQAVLAIETSLAKNSRSRVELRDPEKNYNKMKLDALVKAAPGFNWSLFFKSAGLKNPGDINVSQPEFFKALGELVKNTPIEDLKVYLKWGVLKNSASYLSSAFVNERFEFFSKYLNGAKVLSERWKRVLQTVDNGLGEIVGQLYVKDNFPPEAKQRALSIVKNLIAAMGERIKGLDWMSAATKEQALKKLSTITIKIGYPDKWIDYSSLNIKDDSYYANVVRASNFSSLRTLKDVGKKVDKKKWLMTPQTVNAYYNPSTNEIAFPAGILQHPFFDKDADDAINYGAMGAVIGHEITHGFDDQGRQYDLQGNLRDWWTKEDNDKFKERSKGLISQYNNFAVIDTFKVNGELTLGENIADLGGLTVSLQAFRKTEQYKKNEKIDGYTPLQRFYLSWAQVWRNNIREETAKMYLKIDVHSPAKARVNQPLKNLPDFFEAFDIKPGDPMRLDDKEIVKIW